MSRGIRCRADKSSPIIIFLSSYNLACNGISRNFKRCTLYPSPGGRFHVTSNSTVLNERYGAVLTNDDEDTQYYIKQDLFTNFLCCFVASILLLTSTYRQQNVALLCNMLSHDFSGSCVLDNS
jgi:hypothetical protein